MDFWSMYFMFIGYIFLIIAGIGVIFLLDALVFGATGKSFIGVIERFIF